MTEEDLPSVETPNTLNVSPLGSFAADSQSENDPAKPPAAPSPTMPITKVQPFIHGETPEPPPRHHTMEVGSDWIMELHLRVF